MSLKNQLRKILAPKVFDWMIRVKNSIAPTKAFLESEAHFRKGVDFYKKFIQKGDIVFDIGANLGNRTKMFITLKAKVLAVEPQESCTRFLRSMYGRKAQILQQGVGAEEGMLDFYVSEASTLSSFSKEWFSINEDRFQQQSYKEVIKVPVTTLDRLIQTYGMPSFIKIDGEGFEWEVLKGLKQPIKYLSFEYAVPENQTSLAKCLEHLAGIGFCTFNYSPNEDMSLVLPQWKTYEQFVAYTQSAEFINTSAGDIYVKFN